MINRRRFIASSAAVLSSLSLPLSVRADNSLFSGLAAGCYRDAQGQHLVGVFDELGVPLLSHVLPDRGHGLDLSPDGKFIAVVGRRPSLYLDMITIADGQFQRSHPPTDTCFNGHLCFHPSEPIFYTAENNLSSGEGKIGVWLHSGGRWMRSHSFPSGGIGPHQIAISGDRQLIVANGGILTHPDTGRQKLNLDTMRSNITAFDLASETQIWVHETPLALQKLSLRHIAIPPRGQSIIGVAGQYQGPKTEENIPLLALLTIASDQLSFIELPEQPSAHHNYIGSTAWDASGRWLAVTAPLGGQIYFWDSIERRWEKPISVTDGCAICPDTLPGSFVIASGTGGALTYSPDDHIWQKINSSFAQANRWDNHLIGLAG